MKLNIIVDIFSGRKNPFVLLEGEEADRFADGIKIENSPSPFENVVVDGPSFLGYRGLRIIQTDEKKAESFPAEISLHGEYAVVGQRLIRIRGSQQAEKIIVDKLGYAFQDGFYKPYRDFLDLEIDRAQEDLNKWVEWLRKPFPFPIFIPCHCAPVYEPAWWNDGGQKQYNNNCYNYSTNYRTDTFAQPGRATGSEYTSLAACDVPGQISVKMGAVSDCLIDTPTANNACPEQGNLVATVNWPGTDFHWYRKGANGFWSHKPGSTPCTNVDNAGAAILDPRNANRGPYVNFCTFMNVQHGHIKIN